MLVIRLCNFNQSGRFIDLKDKNTHLPIYLILNMSYVAKIHNLLSNQTKYIA